MGVRYYGTVSSIVSSNFFETRSVDVVIMHMLLVQNCVKNPCRSRTSFVAGMKTKSDFLGPSILSIELDSSDSVDMNTPQHPINLQIQYTQ
jgi:hypothetical protein